MSSPEAPAVLNQPTSVRFSFSLFDLIKCRLWVLNHHKIVLGIAIFFSLLVPLEDLNDPKMAAHSIGARVFAFVFTALIVFSFITLVNTVLQIILALFAKNKGLVGTHEIELGDDCLTEKTEDNASSHRWSAYHKTGSSKNFLFLYVTDNNVIYVPKRCFSSTQMMEQFVDEIRKKSGKR